MAYNIEDFPIETTNKQIEVILPLGIHVLELVVEDSAGLKSAPDAVVITVEREAVPEIVDIKPKTGRAGTVVQAVIGGKNLLGATEVKFEGYRVSAEIMTGGTDSELTVSIEIDPKAKPDLRKFAVVTPAGTAESPSGVVFAVETAAVPEITGIEPSTGRAGTVVQAVITGKNLLGATAVEFDGSMVSAEIMTGGTDSELTVSIEIDPKAKPDHRRFTVVTPAGAAESPSGVVFTVETAAVPEITGIEPSTGRAGTVVQAVITGKNLLGATEVNFSGSGVSTEISSEGTAEKLPVSIGITPMAKANHRKFTVVTPAGTAESPSEVVFTVFSL